ncbi:FkbM family methyltransferase (plasmid) [Pedobacter sp. BS3]|uniref:FkbM family methyltransferase n=1 Tax=Pedobacter sp. BS3 TaxID=2567937 RepID=UPI0011EF7364|nr:FkbM family methyltransferase [Pedobacter sp. BS3]TZF86011.1 FkbM family methyltransferase [Pedobacter sp. BS3]
MGLRTLLGLKKKPEPDYLNESYSQEGEDGILGRFFEGRQKGYFIDIGAHHPKRFSNTYKFYKMGWRGINIDAMPGSMELFKRIRPEDINLEIPVSDHTETVTFYIFNEPALNTFIPEIAHERDGEKGYRIEKTIEVQTRGLQDILNEYLPGNQSVDFLTIDAEGYDFRILQSNNWDKIRPTLVLVESELDFEAFFKSDLYAYMLKQNYEFYAKTCRTYFLKNIDS